MLVILLRIGITVFGEECIGGILIRSLCRRGRAAEGEVVLGIDSMCVTVVSG